MKHCKIKEDGTGREYTYRLREIPFNQGIQAQGLEAQWIQSGDLRWYELRIHPWNIHDGAEVGLAMEQLHYLVITGGLSVTFPDGEDDD